jgi:soluble calcium-activated nucleotidase 1
LDSWGSKPAAGHFVLGVVADRDLESHNKDSNKWSSFFRLITVKRGQDGRYAVADKGEDREIHSVVSEKGRAMELSDLAAFQGRVMTVDDRTGMLFEVRPNATGVVPRQILMDGDGDSDKGFKGEWLTVKDGSLYVGGMGKEWTDNDGNIVNTNPCFVKKVSPDWGVEHLDWTRVYLKIRKLSGYTNPGYMIHEAVHWCPERRLWLFLPRRASKLSYNDVEDESRATNLLITASEDFERMEVRTIGPLEPTWGFSSFKTFPDHAGEIIALKTKEFKGKISTVVTAFNIDTGESLMEPFVLSETVKYEGIEFLR